MEEINHAPEGETTSTGSETSQVDHLRGELESIKSGLSELKQAMAPKPKQLTPEEYNKLLQENPAEAVKLAVQSTVKQELEPLKQELTIRDQKKFYDQKAMEDFPVLKTDKDFQKKVAAQCQEFINNGEYTKDSPHLLLRASQLVASQYKPKNSGGGSEPSSMSGEAPHSGNRPKSTGSKVTLSPAQEKWMSVFGIGSESKERLLKKMADKQKGSGR